MVSLNPVNRSGGNAVKFGWLGWFVLDERKPGIRPVDVNNSYKLATEGT